MATNVLTWIVLAPIALGVGAVVVSGLVALVVSPFTRKAPTMPYKSYEDQLAELHEDAKRRGVA